MRELAAELAAKKDVGGPDPASPPDHDQEDKGP